jgi:hypothetical protein
MPDDAGFQKFAYRVPYTTEQNRYQNYEGEIKAANRDSAREQVIKAAQQFFAQNTAFTPDYQSAEIDIL